MLVSLVPVSLEELSAILPLVEAYHVFESLQAPNPDLEKTLAHLLAHPALGGIWWIHADDQIAGYVAVCYLYSIEFGGLDGVVDELFLQAGFRRRGIGTTAVAELKSVLRAKKVRTLTLEVAYDNSAAQAFYRSLGFRTRSRFGLVSCSIADA